MQTHVTVKIPKDLIEEMDGLIGKHGFRSRGEIAKEAIRKLLNYYREARKPILSLFNLNPEGFGISDIDINQMVDIIQFALTLPEVKDVIRKRLADRAEFADKRTPGNQQRSKGS